MYPPRFAQKPPLGAPSASVPTASVSSGKRQSGFSQSAILADRFQPQFGARKQKPVNVPYEKPAKSLSYRIGRALTLLGLPVAALGGTAVATYTVPEIAVAHGELQEADGRLAAIDKEFSGINTAIAQRSLALSEPQGDLFTELITQTTRGNIQQRTQRLLNEADRFQRVLKIVFQGRPDIVEQLQNLPYGPVKVSLNDDPDNKRAIILENGETILLFGEAYCAEVPQVSITSSDNGPEFTPEEIVKTIVHEFAGHVLDCMAIDSRTGEVDRSLLNQESLDGLPPLTREEQRIFKTERARLITNIQNGNSEINPYAAYQYEDQADPDVYYEFWPMLLETFMTDPELIRAESPEMFALLESFLNITPEGSYDGLNLMAKFVPFNNQFPREEGVFQSDALEAFKNDIGAFQTRLIELQASREPEAVKKDDASERLADANQLNIIAISVTGGALLMAVPASKLWKRRREEWKNDCTTAQADANQRAKDAEAAREARIEARRIAIEQAEADAAARAAEVEEARAAARAAAPAWVSTSYTPGDTDFAGDDTRTGEIQIISPEGDSASQASGSDTATSVTPSWLKSNRTGVEEAYDKTLENDKTSVAPAANVDDAVTDRIPVVQPWARSGQEPGASAASAEGDKDRFGLAGRLLRSALRRDDPSAASSEKYRPNDLRFPPGGMR